MIKLNYIEDAVSAIIYRNHNACEIGIEGEFFTKGGHEVMKVGHGPAGLFEYDASKELIMRLKHDTDMVQSIAEFTRSKGIKAGNFTAIGALKRAELGYYDQRNHEYRKIRIDSPQELASCVGNVSLKDGEPFVHAHVILSDEKGNTRAGHLLEGIVFATEVHLSQLEGPRLERKYDEVTGLSLWDME